MNGKKKDLRDKPLFVETQYIKTYVETKVNLVYTIYT